MIWKCFAIKYTNIEIVGEDTVKLEIIISYFHIRFFKIDDASLVTYPLLLHLELKSHECRIGQLIWNNKVFYSHTSKLSLAHCTTQKILSI